MAPITSEFISDSLENSTVFANSSQGESEYLQDSLGTIDGNTCSEIGAVPITQDPIKAVSGTIDGRIRFLSYSSLLTLHSCPRKFQLYKLRAARVADTDEQSVTFAMGHVIGEGVQLAFQELPYKEILFKMFLMWHAPLAARDDKRRKSFAEAVQAVRKFTELRKAGFLDDYELVYIDGVPACELGFVVNIFDGFQYRGFVDAVLRHKVTGEIFILECKTTWDRESNPAKFKNSGQALGYSIVLDSLFPGLSSYSVLYLVYSTTTLEYTPLPFAKSFESRAEWIRSLVFDVEDIVRYEEAGIYPRRGESCFAFFRECEYINSCGFSTAYLAKPFTESADQIEKDEARYTHKFNLVDLINSQISRNKSISPVEVTSE